MNNPEPGVSARDGEGAGATRRSGALSGRSGEPVEREEVASRSLPALVTALTPDEVIARLRKRSQQGKLPGFEHRGGHVFRVLCFGQPYDKELIGSVGACSDRGHGARVRFRTRLLRKLPVIVVVVMALTIWPGVWITHSLIATYFYAYPGPMWVTAAWYVPLCVIAIPALVKQYRRSMAAADEHAEKIAHGLAGVLDAEAAE